MTRTYGPILVSLVIALGCRRTPPPAPTPAAPAEPAPAVAMTPPSESAPPAATGLGEPAGAPSQTAGGESTGGATASGGVVTAGGAEHAASARARSAKGNGAGDEAAQRKSTARAAADQQRPAAKQRGAKARGGKGGATPAKVVAVAKEAATDGTAAPPSPAAPTARTTLRFKNEASSATYKLVEARFVMDGAELPTVLTAAGQGQTQPVFSGDLPAGRHVIAAHLTYQGADRAVFSYMKGYTFRVKSDDTFVARGDETIAMTITCKEKQGFNDPIEKRLFVTIEGEGRP